MTIPYNTMEHPAQRKLVEVPHELDTVRYRVIQLLNQFPETRNSDRLLYHRYYKHFEAQDTKLDIVTTPPECISRTRRDIQRRNPELAADPEFQEAREVLEEEYREYYGRRSGEV